MMDNVLNCYTKDAIHFIYANANYTATVQCDIWKSQLQKTPIYGQDSKKKKNDNAFN